MDQISTKPGDLWEEIGSIEEDDLPHVLTKLFLAYEEMISKNPDSSEAKTFFRFLANAIGQVSQCNLNRR